MEPTELFHQLAQNAERIAALAAGVTPEAAHWKPNIESWSILEVIAHLEDEERADFRVRLDTILHRPHEPWLPLNPQAWPTERRYNERDLAQSLQGFLAERRAALAWLNSLAAPDWEASCATPWGSIRAGDVLAAWAAHDLLHLRQLVELHYAHLAQNAEPYSTEYAGEW